MDSERLNLGETEEPEMLELEKVRGDDPNFTDSENKPLIAIPKDSEVIEEVSDNPDSEPPATKILFVDKDMDKEYDKIVDIFKKQSLVEAVKDEVKMSTQRFKTQGKDEVDSGPRDKISVETMKFAIKCLHASQNPFHSFMNLLKVKQGNKEKLIAELEKIAAEEGCISRDSFLEYTAKNKKEKTRLPWWQCCDGDPEEKSPEGTLTDYFFAGIFLNKYILYFFVLCEKSAEGTLTDYFFAVAQAQKVTPNPLAFLFPLFGIFLIYIHIQTSDTFKHQLDFRV